MRETRTRRVVVNASIGLVTAFVILAGGAGAANVGVAWNNGSTVITDTSCSASYFGKVAPSPRTVDQYDVAFFYFNATWADSRSPSSAAATHVFHLKIQWAVTYQQNAWYNVTTTGSASGSTQLSLSLTIDYEYNVDITWEASVSTDSCDTGVTPDTAPMTFQFHP